MVVLKTTRRLLTWARIAEVGASPQLAWTGRAAATSDLGRGSPLSQAGGARGWQNTQNTPYTLYGGVGEEAQGVRVSPPEPPGLFNPRARTSPRCAPPRSPRAGSEARLLQPFILIVAVNSHRNAWTNLHLVGRPNMLAQLPAQLLASFSPAHAARGRPPGAPPAPPSRGP